MDAPLYSENGTAAFVESGAAEHLLHASNSLIPHVGICDQADAIVFPVLIPIFF